MRNTETFCRYNNISYERLGELLHINSELKTLPSKFYAAAGVGLEISDSKEVLTHMLAEDICRLGVFHTLSTKLNYSCDELELAIHLLLSRNTDDIYDPVDDEFLGNLSLFKQLQDSCSCSVTDLCAALMRMQPKDELFNRHIDVVFPTSDRNAGEKIHLLLLPCYLRVMKPLKMKEDELKTPSEDPETFSILKKVKTALLHATDVIYPGRSLLYEQLQETESGLMFLKYYSDKTVRTLLDTTGLSNDELGILIGNILPDEDVDGKLVPVNEPRDTYVPCSEEASVKWIALLSSVGRWKKLFGLSLEELIKLLFYTISLSDDNDVSNTQVVDKTNISKSGVEFFLKILEPGTSIQSSLSKLLQARQLQTRFLLEKLSLDDILMARCGILSASHMTKVALLRGQLQQSTFFITLATRMELIEVLFYFTFFSFACFNY